MSLNNFLSYLQQLLTMIDPKDKYSVAMGKNALSATVALAIASDKIDLRTHRAMKIAEHEFEHLAENAKDYAGTPGAFEENEKRRRRLQLVVSPGC